jgi:hypothetical protein
MREQLTQQVLDRAARDDEFRGRLIAEPKAAIAEELGIDIPDSLSVRVEEESATEFVLVLPAKAAPGELRDDELAAAAGGSGSVGSDLSYCGSTCSCGGPST